MDILGRLGFEDVRITHRYDSFRGTSKENVAGKFGVAGINVFGRKGYAKNDRKTQFPFAKREPAW